MFIYLLNSYKSSASGAGDSGRGQRFGCDCPEDCRDAEGKPYCVAKGTSGEGPQGRQCLHGELKDYLRIRKTKSTITGRKGPQWILFHH